MEHRNNKLRKYKVLARVNVFLGFFSLWFIGILLGVIALFSFKRANAFLQKGNNKQVKRLCKNIIVLFIITLLLVGLNIFIFTSYIAEIGGWSNFLLEMKQSSN
ncbi:hypothetical protein NWE55_03390 [Myroides albus]|uniref:Interferon-induced transmembrane protein n=1 Tax=Myroides albus TaxID=2562892 RepID=A0A6I3LNE4_9FLAO|nr:hypothetical protein [Myroides albus]MTG99006.1 hypothetical protein [Myroides albus]UVD80331.1 hypothetical protein NWE55_03390 [Myroides albus]